MSLLADWNQRYILVGQVGQGLYRQDLDRTHQLEGLDERPQHNMLPWKGVPHA